MEIFKLIFSFLFFITFSGIAIMLTSLFIKYVTVESDKFWLLTLTFMFLLIFIFLIIYIAYFFITFLDCLKLIL